MKKAILLFFCCSAIFLNSISAETGSKIAETHYFEFHSNYMLNLHHFLMQKGFKYKLASSEQEKTFDALFGTDASVSASETEKQNILKAVVFYANNQANRNMLFDPEMTELKYALEEMNSVDDLSASKIPAEVQTALKQADVYFQKNDWLAQDKRNRTFLLDKIETIRKIEEQTIAKCERVYQYKWNGKKFRIDLVDYATFFGAYTTTEPFVNAVISSSDKRHEGSQGIEVNFHEVSHAMSDGLFGAQMHFCDSMHLQMDHNVWHTLLFYTTGKIVQQQLASLGQEHELYLLKNKLAELNPNVRKVVDAVLKNGPALLDGKKNTQETVLAVLEESR
ncbi:MAG: hypothetical protein IPF81_13860 [Bacteroidetes bacterium]|nr:hypothetical protein [Bacteroidota bacterium]